MQAHVQCPALLTVHAPSMLHFRHKCGIHNAYDACVTSMNYIRCIEQAEGISVGVSAIARTVPLEQLVYASHFQNRYSLPVPCFIIHDRELCF